MSKLKRESQQLSSVKIGAISSSIGQQKAIDKVGKSNQMITDIKKEFMAFKQNVLQQLERQKKMVNELVQNIVLTLEFELGKLGRIQ